MLVALFLRRFFSIFFVLFVFITILLACSNFFVRLPFIPTLDTLPVIFWTMLPLMALFAIPIAASLSIQIPLSSLMVNHETLFFYYLRNARRAIYGAVFIFSASVLALYIPLVFQWSPKSYSEGKQQLIALAKKQFSRFVPRAFNQPFPGCMVFFKEKLQPSPDVSLYKSLLFSFKNKDRGHYVFTANKAYLYHETLVLNNGAVYSHDNRDHYHATFDRAEIEISKLLDEEQKSPTQKKLKFLKWNELLEGMQRSRSIFTEFHKRLAQILWLFLIPFLALLSIVLFGREGRSNLVACLVSSGLLFLLMYLCTSVGQIFHNNMLIALLCFYVPPFLLLLFFYFFYRKRL